MEIVDLTQTFARSMPVYPGDLASELIPIASHEKEGCVHKILLGKEILIIENLTGLENLVGKSFEVIALPMKLDADSAPARVVARIT